MLHASELIYLHLQCYKMIFSLNPMQQTLLLLFTHSKFLQSQFTNSADVNTNIQPLTSELLHTLPSHSVQNKLNIKATCVKVRKSTG